MVISLSEGTSNIMLDSIGATMNGGSIELLSAAGDVLAVLQLANPAARRAVDGELTLNPITEEDAARGSGVAMSARVVAVDGSEIFSCDVGPEDSNAVIRLSPQRISVGAPVRINSFKLMVP